MLEIITNDQKVKDYDFIERYVMLRDNISNVSKNNKDICPNCGNTMSLLQYYQNGLVICLFCRKASAKAYNNTISAF